MEVLQEPAHLLLQIAYALQPTREPIHVENDPPILQDEYPPPLP
jgi:hypothetical protein